MRRKGVVRAALAARDPVRLVEQGDKAVGETHECNRRLPAAHEICSSVAHPNIAWPNAELAPEPDRKVRYRRKPDRDGYAADRLVRIHQQIAPDMKADFDIVMRWADAEMMQEQSL